MSDEAYLHIDRVTKRFGSTVAVDAVDLAIRRGEFFSLLGPSGCGKTTLLRMIAGFEYPDSGDIFVEGQRITDTPPNLRPSNMVFQSYAIFPHLDVFDNIAYGLRKDRLARAEALQLDHRQRVLDAAVEFGAGQPVLAQAVGDVVEHVQVGKNRIGLEHHV